MTLAFVCNSVRTSVGSLIVIKFLFKHSWTLLIDLFYAFDSPTPRISSFLGMNIFVVLAKSVNMTMSLLLLTLLFFPKNVVCQGPGPTSGEFNLNGYFNRYLHTSGTANIDSNGLISLTKSTMFQRAGAGQVLYNFPRRFKDSANGNVYSFSTTFIFALVSSDDIFFGKGLSFALSPTKGFPNGYYHIVAVELDTVLGAQSNQTELHVDIHIYSRSEMAY